MSNDLIHLLVILIPSAIFLLLLIFGIVFGVMRGFRKSLILGIQAIVAFAIVFILFLIFIFSDPAGVKVVSITNTFMGNGGLQNVITNAVGVEQAPEVYTSLEDILLYVLPKKLDFQDYITEIIINHGAYIMLLVNIMIKIAYAIVSMVIYLILVFIFYIIYALFYPERRHRRRIEKKYERLERDKPYKKRRLWGMLIGTFRGLASGLLIVSFIGSFLFMASGSNGDQKYQQVDWDNEDFSKTYNLYKAIGSYGENGIYKILGSIKNKDNIPYYLYLTEIYFNGKITDEERGLENQSIWLVEEVGAYTKFTNDIIELMNEYAHNEFNDVLSDPSNKEKISALTAAFQDQEFQEKFDKIIDEFDAKTYFANFALSVLDSVALNIDKIANDMPEVPATILNILFNKGYLCPQILDESEDLDKENYEIRPYLKASSLLNDKDTKTLLKAVLPLLATNFSKFVSEDEITVKDILPMVHEIIPTLQSLSILQTERNEEVNGVFERLYQYLDKVIYENIGKQDGNSKIAQTRQKLLAETAKKTTINWAQELNSLLGTARTAVEIAQRTLPDDMENVKIVEVLLDIFEGEKRNANIEAFNSIKADFEKSKLLGLALSTSYLQDLLIDAIKDFAPNAYINPNTQFNTTYNESGEVISRGEIYYLLDGLQQVLMDSQAVSSLKQTFNSNELSTNQILDLVITLSKVKDNNSPLLTLTKSAVLRGVLTAALMKLNDNPDLDLSFYVPKSILEQIDGKTVNLIKYDEFRIISDALQEVINDEESLNSIKSLINTTQESDQKLSATQILEIVSKLTKLKDNSNVLLTLSNSTLIRSILTSVISKLNDNPEMQISIYLPDNIKEVEDGKVINVIKYDELRIISLNISDLALDIAKYLDEDDPNYNNISLILNNNKLLSILDSKMIEGTIASILKDNLIKINDQQTEQGNKELIVMADRLKNNIENWLSDNNKEGEVKSIVRGIQESGLDLKAIIDEASKSQEDQDIAKVVVDQLNKIDTQAKFNKLLLSTILYYTISETIMNLEVEGFKFIVPTTCKKEVNDPPVDEAIKEEDLYGLSKLAKYFVSADTSISTILQSVLNNKTDFIDNKIVLASFINFLLTNDQTKDLLFIPQDLRNLATPEKLNEITLDSPWYTEVSNLLDAFNEILPRDNDGNIVFDDNLSEGIINNIKKLNDTSLKTEKLDTKKSKLQVCYDSIILKGTLTSKLTEALKNQNINDTIEYVKVFDTGHETDSDYKFISITELENLVNAINIIDIDLSDTSNFDISSLSSQILSLNDKYDETNSKLDIVLSSNLINSLLTVNIDKVLVPYNNNVYDESLISKANIESDDIKENVGNSTSYIRVYKKSEISALINALKELGITDLDNASIDPDDIKSKVFELNQSSTVEAEKTKLNVLYKGYILRIIISNQLKPNLTSLVDDPEILNNPSITETSENGLAYIKETEIKALIDSAVKLNITDLNNLNEAELSNKVLTLSSNDVHDIYLSIIIRLIIKKQLFANINPMIENPGDENHPSDLENAKLYMTENNLSYFKEEEVKNLFKALNTLDISDLSNVSSTISQKITLLTQNQIETLYESYAIRLIFAKQIKENVSTLVNNPDDLTNSNLYSSNVNDLNYFTLAEVKALIAGINTIGITSLDNMDANAITSKIKDLTDTNIDTLYNSWIIKLIFAKQINDNLSSMVNRPADLENSKLRETNNNLNYIKITETKALIKSLQILNIDLNNIDGDKVAAKIAKLTEQNIKDMYVSYSIRLIFEKQLLDTLSPIVGENITNASLYVSNDNGLKYFTEDEVIGLIGALNVFEITDFTSFNATNVTSTIGTLNDTKINKLYKSYAIRIIFTNELTNNLESLVENSDDLSSKLIQETNANELTYYKETEVVNIINCLDILQITNLNTLNATKVASTLLTLEDEDITNLYKSNSIKLVLTNQLKLNLAGLVEDANILKGESLYNNDPQEDINYFELNEVKSLVSGIKLFGISDLANIDTDDIASQILSLNEEVENGDTKLDKLYHSTIIKYILANNVTNAIGSLVRPAILSSLFVIAYDITVDYNSYKYYTKSEISALITALIALGIDDIADTDTIDYENSILNTDFSKITDSAIASDIVTTNVKSVFDDIDDLVDHPLAMEERYIIDTIKFYKESELTSIQTFMNSILGESDSINDFSMDKIKLNETTIEAIGNSYILMATLTKNVKDNATIIIPKSTYDDDNELIYHDDLIQLLTSISTLGENKLNNFDPTSLTPAGLTDLDTLTNSYIMRANITANVKNGKNKVYVSKDELYASIDKDLTNKDIIILTKAELTNLISSFNILTNGNSFDAKVSFDTLATFTVTQQLDILKSNVMLHILSDIISSASITAGILTINYSNLRVKMTNMNVVNENSVTVVNYEFVSSTATLNPDIKYAFKASTSCDSYTLTAINENHNILTNYDIVSFIYFIKEATKSGSSYTVGTDYSIVS